MNLQYCTGMHMKWFCFVIIQSRTLNVTSLRVLYVLKATCIALFWGTAPMVELHPVALCTGYRGVKMYMMHIERLPMTNIYGEFPFDSIVSYIIVLYVYRLCDMPKIGQIQISYIKHLHTLEHNRNGNIR